MEVYVKCNKCGNVFNSRQPGVSCDDSSAAGPVVTNGYKTEVTEEKARSCDNCNGGLITAVDGPDAIWYQKAMEADSLKWIMSTLRFSFMKLEKFGVPEVMSKVAVMVENIAYRAEVVGLVEGNGGLVDVRLIDFGRVATVNVADLKRLPVTLSGTRDLAYKGRLTSSFLEIPGVAEKISQMKGRLSHGIPLMLPIANDQIGRKKGWALISYNTGVPTVSPSSVVSSKAESSTKPTPKVESPGAAMVETKPTTKVEFPFGAMVQQITSPSKFFIRLFKHRQEMKDFQGELKHMYEDATPLLDTVELGNCYVVKRPKDQSFYRAKVVEKDEQSTTVLFYDIGKGEKIAAVELKLYPMREEVSKTKPFAFCVGLEESQSWSDVESTRFKQILEKLQCVIYLSAGEWLVIDSSDLLKGDCVPIEPQVRLSPTGDFMKLRQLMKDPCGAASH